LFFTDQAKLKTKPNNRNNCVANYTKERIVFQIDNEDNEFVALVSSSHALAFTSSVLTITPSSSSSVSVSVEVSDSFVLTFLDLSQQANGRYRSGG
jgi:hypothetical protein